jgi:hypothetical protein
MVSLPMGYVEQIPELKTQNNTNILHLRKTCQASIFAAMRSVLVVCSRPGVSLMNLAQALPAGRIRLHLGK